MSRLFEPKPARKGSGFFHPINRTIAGRRTIGWVMIYGDLAPLDLELEPLCADKSHLRRGDHRERGRTLRACSNFRAFS